MSYWSPYATPPVVKEASKEYSSEIQATYDKIGWAITHGYQVFEGDAYTLLLDIDAKTFHWDQPLIDLIHEKWNISTKQWWYSRNLNIHAKIVLLTPLSTPIRIGLQAALGSDPVREVLGLELFLQGMEEPSFLFKPKDAMVHNV